MARHLGQRVVLAFSLTLALGVFSGNSWSQTVIKTVQDLQKISNDLSGSYILGNDIDAMGFNFMPIGCYGVCPNGSAFTGTLDGNGYTIANLSISTSLSQVGLFFQVGSSGTVENLGLTDISVTPSGFSSIGGVAGANSGSITNSYVTGIIKGLSGSAGGLAGANDYSGHISQSYAKVTVTGTGTGGIQLGGLAGVNNGSIIQSYATGAVTGSTLVSAAPLADWSDTMPARSSRPIRSRALREPLSILLAGSLAKMPTQLHSPMRRG